MNSIDGNIEATIQLKRITGRDSIGSAVKDWVDAYKAKGFLDLSNGDSNYNDYRTKIQESTHLFICDYFPMDIDTKDARMIVDGKIYDLLLVDDVMNLHQHYEMYLSFVG